jgi:hypothetical protein
MSVFLRNLDLAKIHPSKPTVARNPSNTNKQHVKFPIKLHRMLQECEEHGKSHIVSWQPDGRSFRVHAPSKFVDMVLSFYFSQTKYRSFQRQLNHYGFERMTKGPLEGSYSHPCFLQDQPKLCYEMRREKRLDSETSNGKKSSPRSKKTSKKSSLLPAKQETRGFELIPKSLLTINNASIDGKVSRSNSLSTASSEEPVYSILPPMMLDNEKVHSRRYADHVSSFEADLLCSDLIVYDGEDKEYDQSLQDANRMFLIEDDFDFQ